MHPSEQIRFAKGRWLENRRIALAISGSIAAVESVKLARELIRYGADVYPYMTPSAEKFISRDSLLFATGHEPVVELTGMNEHLRDFDLILVSPATADTISKAACGIADNAVTTLILANIEKCVFVPAMNRKMYLSEILKGNMEKIKNYGKVLEPKDEEGEMKLPNIEKIAGFVIHVLGNKLRGRRVLVVGGAGYEKIDNFRIITNLSSGRTAIQIATTAYYMGAEVDMLMGMYQGIVPGFINVKRFTTLESLIELIPEISAENYDVVIVPAALPDFKPVSVYGGKIGYEELESISWVETPKFLRELRKEYDGFLVGFKAEVGTDDLINRAVKRLKEHGLNMIVANDLNKITPDGGEWYLIKEGETKKVEGTKDDLAVALLEEVAHEI